MRWCRKTEYYNEIQMLTLHKSTCLDQPRDCPEDSQSNVDRDSGMLVGRCRNPFLQTQIVSERPIKGPISKTQFVSRGLWANSGRKRAPMTTNLMLLPITQCLPSTQSPEPYYETNIEALPVDILVRVFCSLNHDQIEPVFHVCKKFREAACVAREWHFDFNTPAPKRLDGYTTVVTSLPQENCVFPSNMKGLMGPVTPDAPRHGCRHEKSRLAVEEMRQIAAALFPFSHKDDIEHKCSRRKSDALYRVLFAEHELCQEVANSNV